MPIVITTEIMNVILGFGTLLLTLILVVVMIINLKK